MWKRLVVFSVAATVFAVGVSGAVATHVPVVAPTAVPEGFSISRPAR